MQRSEKIYIAGSFTAERERKTLEHMITLVHKRFPTAELYIPMEHKVEGDYQNLDGTWHLSNPAWAQCVFFMDIEGIQNADKVVAMYTGHFGTTGTSWEIGYAYGIGKQILLYIPEWAKEENASLMVLNSAFSYLDEEGKEHSVNKSWLEQFNQK